MTTLADNIEHTEQQRLAKFREALKTQIHLDRMRIPPHTKRERKLHLIALAAPVAAIALDARLVGDTRMSADERWLVQLACVACNLATDNSVRVVRHYKVRRQRQLYRKHKTRRGDVHCSFCGTFLRSIANVPAWLESTHGQGEEIANHTTPCALTRLAGMAAWCPRDTYLIDDDIERARLIDLS